MLRFNDYLIEQKNTHMTHVEELIFMKGVQGTRQAIEFLRDVRDTLVSNAKSKVNITVKWDGAPAIFAGTDPSDGKFFVAKKGIFNKNPKVYKSESEIDVGGELGEKFKTAFRNFKDLGIKGVIQGDLMFTNDIKSEKIDGISYYTFQPNTIVYAVEKNSPLGKTISKAEIGIVWHTSYSGNSFEDMKASFGKPIVPKLRKSSKVWMDDATYRDVSGTATFTDKESKQVTKLLSNAGTKFKRIGARIINDISNNEEFSKLFTTFNNTYVRAGTPFPNPGKHLKEFLKWMDNRMDKDVEKVKTQAAKQKVKKKNRNLQLFAMTKGAALAGLLSLMNDVVNAKKMIIDKLNQANRMPMFLRTVNGFKITDQEGFVAIDKLKGGAVKLVNRLEFSKANFSPDIIKGWQK
jgi:hypothetical protein